MCKDSFNNIQIFSIIFSKIFIYRTKIQVFLPPRQLNGPSEQFADHFLWSVLSVYQLVRKTQLHQGHVHL